MTNHAPSVSVIIPALNEAGYLPALLDCLASQTVSPGEVVVVDGGSTDATPELARRWGARILHGGLPGVSRNVGAASALGDWLLFLDADVRLAPDALEVAHAAVKRSRLDAASTWFVPDSRAPFLRLNHWVSSQYFRLSSRLGWAHSIGAFLLVRRTLHERIGGFDTSIRVAEDQDYVLKLARQGRYRFLRRPVVEIAARRFEKQGGLSQSLKWLGIELHRLLLGEVRGDYFRYFE